MASKINRSISPRDPITDPTTMGILIKYWDWQKTSLYFNEYTQRFTAVMTKNEKPYIISEIQDKFSTIIGINPALRTKSPLELIHIFQHTHPTINRFGKSYKLYINYSGYGGDPSVYFALGALTISLATAFALYILSQKQPPKSSLQQALERKPNEGDQMWKNRIATTICDELRAIDAGNVAIDISVYRNGASEIKLQQFDEGSLYAFLKRVWNIWCEDNEKPTIISMEQAKERLKDYIFIIRGREDGTITYDVCPRVGAASQISQATKKCLSTMFKLAALGLFRR